MPARRRALPRAALAAALLALAPLPAPAQPAAAAPWTVARDPFIELWYHGLAMVEAPSYGTLPLYDARYAVAERRADGRGRALTPLDRAAPELRVGLARDPAFEVLHFVPLWFAGERPEAALAALRAALAPGAAEPMAAAPASLARRAASVAAALPAPAQRAVVRAFVDALDDEWRAATPAQTARRGPDDATLDVLQRRWAAGLGADLATYLAGVDCGRGTIIPVAAIGLEGRIGRAADGRTLVVVAAGVPAADTIVPLLAAVRELAYPLLDQAPAVGTSGGDPLVAQRRRDAAAMRAGALLLERFDPAAAEPYRRLFTTGDLPFAHAYPITPAAEAALRTTISRIAARPGGR